MDNNIQSLSAEEKEHLLVIYHSRLRVFTIAYTCVLALAFICSFNIDREKGRWLSKEDGDGLTRTQMYMVNFLFLGTPLITGGLLIYKRRIKPYKTDAEKGVKEMIPYQIIRKSHFAEVNQYYISFDDPNYMHHEVDDAFYYRCNEGDLAYVSRAPKSKYTFNMNGRFTLM